MAQHLFMDSPDKEILCQTVHTKKEKIWHMDMMSFT